MKKLIGIVLLFTILINASACGVMQTQRSSTQTSTPSQPDTITPSVEPSTVEQMTYQLTEEDKTAAFQEYLEHLQSHSAWFTERYYYSANGNKPISIYDVDGNGIPELLYVHPAEDQSHGEVHFSIYTYAGGSIQKLYEDYVFALAGGEPGCFIFIGNDSKLYSSSSNGYNSAIIRYDYDGYTITPTYLAQSKGRGTSDPESVIYHKNGAIVSKAEFHTFTETIRGSATTILMLTTYNTNGQQDISMSYEEACIFLGGEPTEDAQPESETSSVELTTADTQEEWNRKYAWKKQYYNFLDEVDDSQMSGYALVYIDEDNTPELIAMGASHVVPSYLCWVNEGELCKAPISFSGFCYLEKQNRYLCEEGRTGKGWDSVRRISGNEAEDIIKGEFCTLNGREYYRWNGTDYPDKDAYEAAKRAGFDTNAAKTVPQLSSYRDIRFKIIDYIYI